MKTITGMTCADDRVRVAAIAAEPDASPPSAVARRRERVLHRAARRRDRADDVHREVRTQRHDALRRPARISRIPGTIIC